MECYNCDRPDEAAWAGEAREGGREPSVCFRCDRSGHLAMECPVTAGPEAAAPSVAGWCKVELQTIHRFSQSRRRPLIGPSPG